MSAKEEIIDYNLHANEIEYWIALKGETKYMRFASLLKANGIAVEWNVLKDTYRYDKRLIVNIFKYLSFFEEFLRAQIWNVSKTSYKKLEGEFLSKAIDEVVRLKEQIHYKGFSVELLSKNKELINHLRNCVSHNKIILESQKDECNINEILVAFMQTLPKAYQYGFASDIKKCSKGLNIPSCFVIELQ
ncbi:MAG: hypothetical protein J1F65_03660 [Clostridiales bacterium]|nr:hypothetical protein [Clostridiales bacterium]